VNHRPRPLPHDIVHRIDDGLWFASRVTEFEYADWRAALGANALIVSRLDRDATDDNELSAVEFRRLSGTPADPLDAASWARVEAAAARYTSRFALGRTDVLSTTQKAAYLSVGALPDEAKAFLLLEWGLEAAWLRSFDVRCAIAASRAVTAVLVRDVISSDDLHRWCIRPFGRATQASWLLQGRSVGERVQPQA
jgi:hypothetical protein